MRQTDNVTDTARSKPHVDPDSYELADRYRAETGRVFLSGLQAIARLPVDQLRIDRGKGLNTAAFVSGYQGSPVGMFGEEVDRAHRTLPDLPVVNRPGVRSPHSYGRSLDVNTWENPYRSPTGLVPNAWWQSHSHPRVAWRSRDHRVVQILTRAGFRWTYGNGDTQHFDVGGGHGRAIAAPPARRCGGAASD